MDAPIITGRKKSKLYFNKIEIFEDRVEAKAPLLPKKMILLKDILYWTEINKRIKNTPVIWATLTVYSHKTKCSIDSLHWENYHEIKALLTHGKERNSKKEEKIYNSFWS